MNEVSENIQLLLDDILLFHEEADGSMSSEQLADWIRAHLL